MTSLILIIICSAINACINALKNHFDVSVFKNLNPLFWSAKLRRPKQINAHLILRTLVIMLLIFAIIFYQTLTDNVPIDAAILGISWKIVEEIMDEYLWKN